MDLILTDVRCFAGCNAAPLAPLTFLVGENSCGKSTMLAMARAVWDAVQGKNVDFNEDPFRLGAFEDIVSKREPPGSAFSIGCHLRSSDYPSSGNAAHGDEAASARLEVAFEGRGVQPVMVGWSLFAGECEIRFAGSVTQSPTATRLHINCPEAKVSFGHEELPITFSPYHFSYTWEFLKGHLMDPEPPRGPRPARPIPGTRKPISKRSMRTIAAALMLVRNFGDTGRPRAVAPVRARPLRTYDPVSDTPSPEGGHTPVMLLKALTSPEGLGLWEARLLERLHKYGREAGLFNKLQVRRMGGESAGTPFQVMISVDDNGTFNLVDVGFGVSQVMPVLVDAISSTNSMIMLQQPEVHLHPRAQAAFGSVLAEVASTHRGAPMLVETHSDHMIDRVRMDIRDRRGVSAEDVRILYFERSAAGVKIHPISIDEQGNLHGQPPSYRSFFLQEEARFLRGWG